MSRAIRQSLWAVRLVLRIIGFTLETVILGGIFLWRMSGWIRRLPHTLATEIQCPRGHRVPLDGLTKCSSCGAVREGSLLRCFVCGARPTYIICPRCGLAVGNPLP